VPQGFPKSEILGLDFDHLIANVSKAVSRSVACQLELNISSTRAFKKCLSQGGMVAHMAGLSLVNALVGILFY